MPRKEVAVSLSSVVMVTIFSATVVAVAALTQFGIFGIAHGQGRLTLTPEQKAAMCDPNNPKLNFVNTTESHICGIPKAPTATANTTTTGTETETPSPSDTSIA